jgi:hypothetical protein
MALFPKAAESFYLVAFFEGSMALKWLEMGFF